MESVKLRIARHDPENKRSGWSEFQVELHEKTTVLDCLDRIQRTEDPSLAFRYACRVGMCGSCAMVVNGKERWTCRTLVRNLGAAQLTIEPLRHMPVIRDLAVDFTPLWQKYRRVQPAFEPGKQTRSVPRSVIEPNLQCISCGACYSSCTFVGTDPLYIGPHAMNRVFTLVEDSRDGARDVRLDLVDNEHGCWKCHIQQNCTEVCPMDLSPSAGIQHLKRAVLEKRVFSPSRRKFAFGAIGAAVAAVIGYVFYEPREWITVGPVSSIPADTVLPFVHEDKKVFLRKIAAGDVIALSQRCSHQGCVLRWDGPANQFKCPCHFGVFTANGQVVSGAPVRPLESFETRIEGDQLQVFI